MLVLEYDVPSLYGFSQSIETHKAFQGFEDNSLILSRSIYVGSSKSTTHRASDNKNTWESWDTTGMGILINMNLMGVGNLIQMLLYLDLVIVPIQVQVSIMNQLNRRRFVNIVILATQ